MSEGSAQIRYTINNESLHPREILLNGVEDTRRKLGKIGINGGLHMNVHTRSRLYAELLLKSANGSFVNEREGVRLLASGAQSYSPTLPEAWGRFKGRKNEMYFSERLKRLGQNVIEQRATKPPVQASLKPLAKISELADNDFFATLYPEELQFGQTYHDANAPYERVAVISPDTVEKLDIKRIFDFSAAVATRGISMLTYNSYHGVRFSQTGKTQLPLPLAFLPTLAAEGKIRQFTIGLNQAGLPPASGIEYKAATHNLTAALLKDEPEGEEADDLHQQLRAVLDNLPPDQPVIDITLSGKLGRVTNDEMRHITNNVKRLVESR